MSFVNKITPKEFPEFIKYVFKKCQESHQMCNSEKHQEDKSFVPVTIKKGGVLHIDKKFDGKIRACVPVEKFLEMQKEHGNDIVKRNKKTLQKQLLEAKKKVIFLKKILKEVKKDE